MSPELNKERIIFEAYYETKGIDRFAQWHPEHNRYTIMSMKQQHWETWAYARGLDYTPYSPRRSK